tara:strand:+ start:127 stop:399 length:273 start_codon:yes stop_codon:yes gene_type:complete
MTLRTRFLDAIIDGELGNGLVVTRQEFINYFSDENPKTTGCFLSNSEIDTGQPHSPMYSHFTLRVDEGVYRVHPGALNARMVDRKILAPV